MISWPHFDASGVLAAAIGAVVGWLTRFFQANTPKGK